jgi:hypothetical protein
MQREPAVRQRAALRAQAQAQFGLVMADRFETPQMVPEAGPVVFRLGDPKSLRQAFLD